MPETNTTSRGGIKPGVKSESQGSESISYLPMASQSTSRKRKATKMFGADEYDEKPSILAQDELKGTNSKPKRPRKKKDGEPVEKRLRKQRAKPPGAYLERLGRVRSQRMFLIDRNRRLCHDGTHEQEIFDIAGTTGNIYQVTISKVPSCTCPDSSKGNQCKHIIYVGRISQLFRDHWR